MQRESSNILRASIPLELTLKAIYQISLPTACCDSPAYRLVCRPRRDTAPPPRGTGEAVTAFHSSHREPDSDLEETFFLAPPAGKLISLKCADVQIICRWTQQICSQQAAPVSAREQSVTPDDVPRLLSDGASVLERQPVLSILHQLLRRQPVGAASSGQQTPSTPTLLATKQFCSHCAQLPPQQSDFCFSAVF